MFDRRYGVTQFVARLRNPTTGVRFNVFRTGEAGWYLFDPLDDDDCSRCMAFAVRAADLKPAYRRALAHGWGNTL